MANHDLTGISSITHKGLSELKVDAATFEVTTAMIDNADDNIFTPVVLPSNARLIELDIYSDDLDSNVSPTLAYNIGLAYTGIGRGQVGKLTTDIIDADCIGTAVTVGQAADIDGGHLQFEARDIANVNKELWEVAGLSADTGGYYSIVFDLTTAAATPVAGTITIVAKYV